MSFFASWKRQKIDEIDPSPFRLSYRELLFVSLWLAGLTAGYAAILWSGWTIAYLAAIVVLGLGALSVIGSWSV